MDSSENKSSAIFLDRDGVINVIKNNPFVNTPDDMIINHDTAIAIKVFRDYGFKVICVTNQGGIANGYLTHEDLDDIHYKMRELLAAHGAYLDDVLYCPHYWSETPTCECRKPRPGMLLEAAARHDIDLFSSYMVGDRKEDLMAGIAANVHQNVLISDVKNLGIKYGLEMYANIWQFSCLSEMLAFFTQFHIRGVGCDA